MDLGAEANSAISISWEWPYYISDDYDLKDTHLGDEAADGNPATISISVDCTVTQID